MEDVNTAAKWAVACSAFTFSVTAVVLMTHLVPVTATIMIGSKLEGLITFVLVGVWTATVSIVTNTENSLGAVQSNTNQVSNGNLYYFSWAGFVLSIVLFVSYLRSAYGLDLVESLKERSSRLSYWSSLLAATMVVMGSSTRIWIHDCKDGNDGSDNNSEEQLFTSAYCTRTKFAIILGSGGVFFSLVVVSVKLLFSTAPYALEFALSSLLTVLNTFGVAYITSNSGPGRAIGNLYYFSWISFILSAVIAVECFNSSKSSEARNVQHRKIQDNPSSSVGDLESSTYNHHKELSVEPLDGDVI